MKPKTFVESPYGAAKRQGLPCAVLRIDGRTARPKEGALKLEGPVTLEQAKRIARLIAEITSEKDEGEWAEPAP